MPVSVENDEQLNWVFNVLKRMTETVELVGNRKFNRTYQRNWSGHLIFSWYWLGYFQPRITDCSDDTFMNQRPQNTCYWPLFFFFFLENDITRYILYIPYRCTAISIRQASHRSCWIRALLCTTILYTQLHGPHIALIYESTVRKTGAEFPCNISG